MNLVAAFEDQKIEGLRQFVLDAWMMTANSEFARNRVRGHDLWRTAASIMTSDGIRRFTVGRILNHVEPGVTKIYDRYSYDKEKKEALEAWSKRLMLMVSDLKEVKSEA